MVTTAFTGKDCYREKELRAKSDTEAIRLFRNVETIDEERREAAEQEVRRQREAAERAERERLRKEAEAQQARILEEKAREHRLQQQKWQDMGLCRHCGGAIKGLFKKRCANCGIEKDY